MENINDSYFDGYYQDLWRSLIPGELTTRETDFILQYFGLHESDKVLDIMCGFGRHAIALARKGISVTAVDNLTNYINEINEVSDREQLPLKAYQSDILQFKSAEQFDLAICMGNSLNFFNSDDCGKLLNQLASHLRKGGHLLINSWSIAEIAIRQFKEKTWSVIDGKKFIVDSQFLFQPTRIESEHLILAPDGQTETKKGIDYIYSVAELESMLKNAGFVLQTIDSIPNKKKFTVGDSRIYIIAEKL